jgi:protein-disulfide isomerase
MMDQSKGEKPALTVIIQSWWTPALALIMLVVGLLAGYFGHQLLNKNPEPTGVVAAVVTSVPTLLADQATVPTTTVDPTMAAITSNAQLMTYLVSNTTRFQGDPNAKVTILEFSDYQ